MTNRIEHFNTLVARQPENTLFRFSLAQALEAEGRASEAIEHYRYCCDARADWMMPRILLGKILLHTDAASARPYLETALALAIAQDHQEPADELRALLEMSP